MFLTMTPGTIETSAGVNSPQYWSSRYRSGDTPWDLGRETPALQALLQRVDFPHPTHFYQPHVAVPGCGYGHDALLVAEHGYRVAAIDFASEPLEYLQQMARLRGLSIDTVCSDVFTLPLHYHEHFDIVYEYTCYCAIDPSRRQEYATCIAAILKPNGILAGLFFPLDDLERIGPPFTVREEEIRTHFEHAGLVLIESQVPFESHPARAGREQLMIFRKPL